MGNSRNFVNNKFFIYTMVYEHKGGSPSKEAMAQFGSPAVASVGAAISHKLATSTMTSRAPLLPTCVYRSLILGKQEKTVSGCQENSPALHNVPTTTLRSSHFFPSLQKQNPHSIQIMFFFVCLFVRTPFPTPYLHSVLAPLRLESCVFALLKRRYRLL